MDLGMEEYLTVYSTLWLCAEFSFLSGMLGGGSSLHGDKKPLVGKDRIQSPGRCEQTIGVERSPEYKEPPREKLVTG